MTSASKNWNEARVAEIMKENPKMKRIEAVRKMRTEAATTPKAAAKVAAVKAKKESKKGETTQHVPSKAMQEKIDDAIRATVKKERGGIVAVEGSLGQRNSNGPQGAPYQRYLLADGHTVFVSSWHVGDPVVSVSEKPASKSSYTVKNFLARKARKAARELKAEKSAAAPAAKAATKNAMKAQAKLNAPKAKAMTRTEVFQQAAMIGAKKAAQPAATKDAPKS
jgi:hypothetical protein